MNKGVFPSVVFDDFNNQQRAVELLEAELKSGWVPHAHLFVGPGGVGRVELARRLAAVLLCGQDETGRCGECKSCHALSSGNHPDYFEIGVPDGRQSLPISSIRGGTKSGERGLQEEAALKPVLSGRRVFVVRDTERMTVEAANCFLKTLEEPPGECYFLLIASGLQDIPDTIISRCRLIKMSALPVDDVAALLQEEGASSPEARWLARRTWGSPGRSRRFREDGLPEANNKLVQELLQLGPRDNFRMAEWMREAADDRSSSSEERREALQELVECVSVFYRDAAISRFSNDGDIVNEKFSEQISRYASQRDLDEILECADVALETLKNIGANANQRLALLNLFTRLAS